MMDLENGMHVDNRPKLLTTLSIELCSSIVLPFPLQLSVYRQREIMPMRRYVTQYKCVWATMMQLSKEKMASLSSPWRNPADLGSLKQHIYLQATY